MPAQIKNLHVSLPIGTLPRDFQYDGRADTVLVSGEDGGLAFEIRHFLPG
jgi:hypothetical protein